MPATARLAHQPALEGLRGIAVAGVLLYHAGMPWMTGGYLGVSSFFVLSGFLITSLLLAEHGATGTIALGAFWERRLRRIAPAALAALLGIAVFGAFVADSQQLARMRGDGVAALAWATNWWFIANHRDYADIFASPSPVQHFWSLAIEEQFYVVFPLLVAVTLRVGRRSHALLGAVLLALAGSSALGLHALAATDVSTARLYFGTDTRAQEPLVGALLAVALAGRPALATVWRRAIGVLGVVGLVACLACWATIPQDAEGLYRGGLLAHALATAAVVAAAVQPAGPVRTLLALAPLRALGRISYGAYLYHFPLFLWLTPERTGLEPWPLLALRLLPALGLATLSHRWLEEPVRSGRVPRGGRPWIAAAGGALVVGIALVAVTARTPAAEPPLVFAPPQKLDAITAPPGVTRIMVVGDSVAHGLAQALARWGQAGGGAAVLDFTGVGCGLVSSDDSSGRDPAQRRQACTTLRAQWARAIELFRPHVVAVYPSGWDIVDRERPEWVGVRRMGDPEYDRWLRAELGDVARRLGTRGARVVWLPTLCLRHSPIGAAPFDTERIRHLNETIVEPLASTDPGRATFIDLFREVCPRGRFSAEIDGIAGARPDGIHFSEAGADAVARWLGPQLVRIGQDTEVSR